MFDDTSEAALANVAQNTINVAIEGAVAQLKTAQPQSGTAPAAGNDNGGGSSDSSSGSTGTDASNMTPSGK